MIKKIASFLCQKNKTKIALKYVILSSLLIFSSFFIIYQSLDLQNVTVSYLDSNNKTTRISRIKLPYYRHSSNNIKKYIYKGNINYNIFKNSNIRIIPDDHLEYIKINNTDVSLKEIPERKLSDWGNGFKIDLKKYLKKGNNTFEISVTDSGGLFGINIFNTISGFKSVAAHIIFIFLFILNLFCILRDLKIDNIATLIIILSVILRIIYVNYTDYNQRSHDVDGHIEYIKYISDNLELPEPDKGWQFYQPPLYYATTSIFYKILSTFNYSGIYKILQLLSMVYFTGFIIFASLIFRLIKFPKLFFYLTMALFAFWPSGIIHSVRIGNDVLYYFLYAIALFFIIRWNTNEKKKDLIIASIFASLLLLTKSNAIILLGILGVILLIKFIKSKDKIIFIKKNIIICIFFAISGIINFGDNIYYTFTTNREVVFLNDVKSSLNSALFVNNKPYNYLYFDMKNYLEEEFTSPWDDTKGRQLFWNYLLKTSLFGEFSYNKNIHKILGMLQSILLLIMILLVTVRLILFFKNKSNLDDYNFPLFLNFIFSILAIIIFRIKFPASCSGDFRYIFPILLSFCPFATYTIFKLRQKKIFILEYLAYITLLSFIISTILFFTNHIF